MRSSGAHASRIRKLVFQIVTGAARREELYDRLYALNWGETTTNNYGFAPADGHQPERFQLQLYTELLRLFETTRDLRRVSSLLEISCGRGGGLAHVAHRLPRESNVVGLDFSAHAIAFCKERYEAVSNLSFVRGNALHLPFTDASFDVVINVEASHAYGNDTAFLREVSRVLRSDGCFLYADYRTRKKVRRLEQSISAAGLSGDLHDITDNVVGACDLDAERRRRIIRGGLRWYHRPLLTSSLEGYSGLPGTPNCERFRSGDRIYFLACMRHRE